MTGAETAGASSRTTWALVPPTPNELTPARRTPSHSHGPYSLRTTKGPRSRCSSGLGLVKCRVPGIARCLRQRIVLIKLAIPAADLQVTDVGLDRAEDSMGQVWTRSKHRMPVAALRSRSGHRAACPFRGSRHSSRWTNRCPPPHAPRRWPRPDRQHWAPRSSSSSIRRC